MEFAAFCDVFDTFEGFVTLKSETREEVSRLNVLSYSSVREKVMLFAFFLRRAHTGTLILASAALRRMVEGNDHSRAPNLNVMEHEYPVSQHRSNFSDMTC